MQLLPSPRSSPKILVVTLSIIVGGFIACDNNKSSSPAPAPKPATCSQGTATSNGRFTALALAPSTSSNSSNNLDPDMMYFSESTDSNGKLISGKAIKDYLAQYCDSCHTGSADDDGGGYKLDSYNAAQSDYDNILSRLGSNPKKPMPPVKQTNASTRKTIYDAFTRWQSSGLLDNHNSKVSGSSNNAKSTQSGSGTSSNRNTSTTNSDSNGRNTSNTNNCN